MIKRLFKIAQAEFNDFAQKNKWKDTPSTEPDFFDRHQEQASPFSAQDPLAKYYANL